MFTILYQYFILQKSLSLPGLGTIRLQHIPAINNISDHVVEPPSRKAIFDDTQDAPNKNLFQFIANRLGIEEWEAIKKINDFSFDLKAQLKQGQEVVWENIGTLKSDLAGTITLDSKASQFDFIIPVPAKRVIRSNTNHSIVRGDKEVTEVFNVMPLENAGEETEETGSRKKRWLLWASLVLLAALTTLIIHFYMNGFTFKSIFNTQKQPVREAEKTYIQAQ